MRQRINGQHGMVLWVMAVVAAFAALAVSNLMILSHGEIRLLNRSEQMVRCEIAARSVFQDMTVDLRLLPWSKRPCLKGPVHRQGTYPDGIAWEAILQDAKDRQQSVDLWIVTRLDNAKQVVFHRVDVRISLFQKMNDLTPVCFTFLDGEKYDKPGSIANALDSVAAILAARDEKAQARNRASVILQPAGRLSEVFQMMGLDKPSGLLEAQEPIAPGTTAGYSRAPLLLAMADFPDASLALEGGLTVKDFQVVQGGYQVDTNLAERIKRHLGTDSAARVLDAIQRLQLDPDSGREILRNLSADSLGGGVTEAEAAIINNLADRIIDAREEIIWKDPDMLIDRPGLPGDMFDSEGKTIEKDPEDNDKNGSSSGLADESAGEQAGESENEQQSTASGENDNQMKPEPVASGAIAGSPAAAVTDGIPATGTGLENLVGTTGVGSQPEVESSGSNSSFRGGRLLSFLDRWAKAAQARRAGNELSRKIDAGTATAADVQRYEERFGAYEQVSRKRIIFAEALSIKDRLLDKARQLISSREPDLAGTRIDNDGQPVVSNETAGNSERSGSAENRTQVSEDPDTSPSAEPSGPDAQ